MDGKAAVTVPARNLFCPTAPSLPRDGKLFFPARPLDQFFL